MPQDSKPSSDLSEHGGKEPSGQLDDTVRTEVLGMIEQLWSATPDLPDESHYSAPDGTQPMPEGIWARLDLEKVDAALAAIKANFGGNGHLRFVGMFEASTEEKQALAEVAGSIAVREVDKIFSEVDHPTEARVDEER